MREELLKMMIIIFIVYNYGSHLSNMRPPTPYKYSRPLNVKNASHSSREKHDGK